MTSSLDFYFLLSLLPSFFTFLASFFFSCAGHWIGFILVGKVLRKAFKILGWGERKGRWIVEQDFHGSFQVNVTWFSAFFSGVLDWIVLILVWFERFLHSAPLKNSWHHKWYKGRGSTWAVTGGSGANGLIGFENSPVRSSGASRFSCWASNFLTWLVQRARVQASPLGWVVRKTG